MTDCRLVIITWLDSRQTEGSWQWLTNYEKMDAVEVVSVGWLIQDDDTVKVLAQSMAPDGENVQTAGRKAIPACCVKKIENLIEAAPSSIEEPDTTEGSRKWKRGDRVVRNGKILEFIEEELEGEKWALIGSAPR